MKRYPLLENNFSKAVFGVYLMAMLFLSRDTLFSSCILGFAKSQILMFAWILLLGLWFLIRNRKDLVSILKDQRMLLFAASALVLLMPMLLKQDWQLMYFSILICLFFGIFLTFFTDIQLVARCYVILLTLLGLYSVLATYGLRELAQAGIITPAVFWNSKQWDFYNFGFAYAVTWELWHRNFGIFREPGVYQFFVILAVYLNNYAVNWKRQWLVWVINGILTVTMISTFAIGGFVELGLFVVFLYFDKKWYKTRWGKIGGVAAVAVVIGLVASVWLMLLFYDNFTQTIFFEPYNMFIRLTTESDSLLDRLDAIFTNLRILFQKPLLGDMVASVLHGTNHNTSSTLLLYAILGILGGSVNVAAWIALLWKRERNLFGNLLLLLILFMSFNTQNLVTNVFFWLFPMMALVERSLPLLQRSK